MFELSGTDSPPGASVYREQAISRVGHSRLPALIRASWTWAVLNIFTSAAAAPPNRGGSITVGCNGYEESDRSVPARILHGSRLMG
jgi:hypothetical protein